MKHTAEFIERNYQDYKVCMNCGTINLKEADKCNFCKTRSGYRQLTKTDAIFNRKMVGPNFKLTV